MTSAEELESAVLEKHEAHWVEQGYRVIRHPRPHEIPEFLGRFLPDALALGPEPNLVVEVIRKGSANAEEKVRRLKALLGDRKDWRLEILYSGEAQAGVEPTTSDAISELLGTARRLSEQEPRAALLLTWAGLEGLARLLDPRNTVRPQTPGRVVELLASAGYIAPSEAHTLRAAAATRNRLIHGDLSMRPTSAEVTAISDIAEELLRQLLRREQSTS